MAGYPYLTVLGLCVLALIFGLLLSEAHTRVQFLSMAALTAIIAITSEVTRRVRRNRQRD
jgi:AAT family amino acid transporter